MENKANLEGAAVAQESPKSKVISQKYRLKVNLRHGLYHTLPKKLRKNEGYIGSQFKTLEGGRISRAIIRGLNSNQERYFASELINKTPQDQGYEESMLEYWADYRIFVQEDGLKLDASYTLEKVNVHGVGVVEIEVPVNLTDYIMATFAKQNSRVAFKKEDKDNSDLFDFILEDLSVEEKAKHNAFSVRTSAIKAYSDVISNCSEKDHSKVDWLLEVLKDPHKNFYRTSYIDKCIELETYSLEKPQAFIDAYNNPELEIEATIFRLLQSGIITKEGEAIFFGDIAIGASIKEAKLFFKDGTKTGLIAKMKAQLNEILKKETIK